MSKSIQRMKYVFSFILMGVMTPVWSDTATPAPTAVPTPVVTINGLVDTYYSYNFNNASGAYPTGNGYYNFNTVSNSFTLGLAEMGLSAKMGDASLHTNFVYGQTATVIGLGSPILQAYAEWVTGSLTLDAGQFVTPLGQEVIESKSNWNYSRSFLFSYAIPYYHTGLRMQYVFDPKYFNAEFCVFDGWNTTFASDASGQKTYHLMLSGTPDPSLTVTLQGIYGPIPGFMSTAYGSSIDASAMRFVGEGILIWNATDKLSLAVDYNYGSDDAPTVGFAGDIWSGLAGYARYQIESDWAVAGRGEEFVDHHGAVLGTGLGTSLWEGTLTLEHTLSTNLLVRLEGRYDWATDPDSGTELAAFPGVKSNQLTGTFGAVYSF